mmetsp:Transcript_19687/g.52367  ORF Transcript_19687/g.52367 Transcript_19687/m.52367 type:complete len:217 (-) Transcript_19687:451-1101(-)
MSTIVRPLSRACPTLDAPGSFPTRRKSVFPDTADVTVPPNDSIIALARSFPRFSPAPPPISGNTPVSTKRLPLYLLRSASSAGRGMTKAVFAERSNSPAAAGAPEGAATEVFGGAWGTTARDEAMLMSSMSFLFFCGRAQFDLTTTCAMRTSWSLAASSANPVSSTSSIPASALRTFAFATSSNPALPLYTFSSSGGSPFQIRFGTTQHARWHHRP